MNYSLKHNTFWLQIGRRIQKYKKCESLVIYRLPGCVYRRQKPVTTKNNYGIRAKSMSHFVQLCSHFIFYCLIGLSGNWDLLNYLIANHNLFCLHMIIKLLYYIQILDLALLIIMAQIVALILGRANSYGVFTGPVKCSRAYQHWKTRVSSVKYLTLIFLVINN